MRTLHRSWLVGAFTVATTLALTACGPGRGTSSAAAPASPAPASTPAAAAATSEPAPTPTRDPKTQDVTGLLFLAVNTGKFEDGFDIYGISPSTGAVTLERSFPRVTGATIPVNLWTPLFVRLGFDPQFHRAVATSQEAGTGSEHVGWYTDAGQYVDVSAAVAQGSGAFSGKVWHKAPAFGPDGAFYYVDAVAKKIMKVTSLSPSSPSDATPIADADPDTVSLTIWPSGTVTALQAGSIARVENTRPGVAGQGRVEGWLNATTMLTVSTDMDQISESDASADPSQSGNCFGSGTCENIRPLLPAREGRISWNPVPSPDGSTVAFLSALKDASDPVQLFTVPAGGGEPAVVKVTDLTFNRPQPAGLFGDSQGAAQLIGWYK